MAKILMVAAMTFKGIEGLIKNGQEFEVNSERRADELERNHLAKYKKKQKQTSDGDKKGENNAAGSAENKSGERAPERETETTETAIDELKTHAEVDAYAKAHDLAIPSKDDAKMDDRKAALKQAIGNAGE